MSSSNKRYYWLKLKEDFFEDDTIQWLEEQENGKDYVIFYLKLALKSLNDDGKLIRYVGETLIPYDVKALSRLTNTPTDTVVVALELFGQIGLISRLDSGEIYMNQIDEMVGSETAAAEKMRRLRAKQNDQKQLDSNSSNNVTESYPELLEIEKEIELDKDIEQKKSGSTSTSLTESFEEVWKLYPNKKGKKKSKASYKRAIKNGTTQQEVIDGIERYKRHLANNDWLKPAHGSTWFNNNRWEDEYSDNNVGEDGEGVYDF